MSLITKIYEKSCDKCEKITKHLYEEYNFGNNTSKFICSECFIKKNGNCLKGKSSFLPCKLCKPPTIHWYEKRTYGKIAKDCGNHVENVKDNAINYNIFDD